jgi:hypothetical protein
VRFLPLWIRLRHHGARLAQAESKLSKQPLALANGLVLSMQFMQGRDTKALGPGEDEREWQGLASAGIRQRKANERSIMKDEFECLGSAVYLFRCRMREER